MAIKEIFQSPIFLTILLFISGTFITGCANKYKEPPRPDKILHVSDKLPVFRKDFVINWKSSSGPLKYTGREGRYGSDDFNKLILEHPLIYIGNLTIGKRHLGGPYIYFKEKAQIVLQNGTRYICTNPDGCEVIDFIITKGSIEVYYNKNGK